MTLEEKIARTREIVADILGIEAEALTQDAGMDVTKGWDSMRNLTILMEIEQQFGLEFSTEDLTETHTIAAIAARLP